MEIDSGEGSSSYFDFADGLEVKEPACSFATSCFQKVGLFNFTLIPIIGLLLELKELHILDGVAREDGNAEYPFISRRFTKQGAAGASVGIAIVKADVV